MEDPAFSTPIDKLKLMFNTLDTETIESTYEEQNGNFDEAIKVLLNIFEDSLKNKKNAKGFFSRQPRKYSQLSTNDDESDTKKIGFGRDITNQQNNNNNKDEEIVVKRRAGSMYAAPGTKLSPEKGKGFFKRNHDNIPVYSGPEGEEIPLGTKQRSNSFYDKLKQGITSVFRKGSQDAQVHGAYSSVNTLDDLDKEIPEEKEDKEDKENKEEKDDIFEGGERAEKGNTAFVTNKAESPKDVDYDQRDWFSPVQVPNNEVSS